MNKKHLIKVIGDITTYAITINFYVWLFVAMFSNNQVTVYFNHFNEALLEYIIYIILLPIMTYSTFINLRTYRRRKHESRTNRKQTQATASDNN